MRIAREGERVGALAERAGRAMDTLLDARWARYERDTQLLAAFSYRGVWRVGLRWCAIVPGGRYAPQRPFRQACRSTSSFPTALSARVPKSCRRSSHRAPNRRGGEDVATMTPVKEIFSADQAWRSMRMNRVVSSSSS